MPTLPQISSGSISSPEAIDHEVCALSVGEAVEVGLTVGVWEAMVFDRPSVIERQRS